MHNHAFLYMLNKFAVYSQIIVLENRSCDVFKVTVKVAKSALSYRNISVLTLTSLYTNNVLLLRALACRPILGGKIQLIVKIRPRSNWLKNAQVIRLAKKAQIIELTESAQNYFIYFIFKIQFRFYKKSIVYLFIHYTITVTNYTVRVCYNY